LPLLQELSRDRENPERIDKTLDRRFADATDCDDSIQRVGENGIEQDNAPALRHQLARDALRAARSSSAVL